MVGVFSRVRCDCGVEAVQEEESSEGVLWVSRPWIVMDVSGVFGEDLVDG